MTIHRNYGTGLRRSLSGGFDVVPNEPPGADYRAPSPIPCRSWNSISPEWEKPVAVEKFPPSESA